MEDAPPKEKKTPEELTCPEWMMTMGDCMSLLLTFFVLLLTFSTTSKSRLMDVIGVMKGAFSFIKTEMVKESAYNDGSFDEADQRKVSNEGSSSLRLTPNSIMRYKTIITENLGEVGFKHPLEMAKLDQGFAIDIAAEDVFLEGTSKLSFKGNKLINEVGNLTKNITNEIRITSYMDKRAVSKRFNSDWKKAIEKNLTLARTLRDKFSVAESRFSVAVHVIKGSTSAQDFSKIRIMLVDKLDVNETSISEFLKEPN
jgi:chemotaxis protein MotB